MDQVKDFLRACVKYRFWIAVVIAALMPVIAYFVGAGTIQAEAAAKTAAIDGAVKGVQPYIGGVPYNRQYAEEAGKVFPKLEENVAESWRKLYDRQAPLLRWPDAVHENITKWGRRKPDTKEVPDRVIAAEIDKYRITYPKYVENEVYLRFNPFNYETGEGVVVAPPKDALLRPVNWEQEKFYNLSDIWAAQEKLWIQSTMLQVVADVNKGVKTWDDAPIRQINTLEVASDTAQDQVSMAKGKSLTEIAFEGEEEETAAEEGAGMEGGGPMEGMMPSGMEGAYRRGMGGDAGMGPGGMMGGGAVSLSTTPDTIYYVESDTPMFQIVPVYMSVMIRQDKVIEYLCALENSPMEIQVLEFEQSKPAQRIQKPEKGTAMMNFAGYGGYAGLAMGRGMMEGMMESGMGMMPGMSSGMGRGMMPGMGMEGMMPGMGGYGGMMGGGQAKAVGKGTDVRSKNSEAERKKIEESIKKQLKAMKSPFDPYFDVVQVSIYGQARFYRKPPEPEAKPESESGAEAAAEGAGDAAAGDAAKAEAPATPEGDATKADGEAAPEAPKAAEGEAPKAEPKAEASPAEAPKAEPAATPEAPKAEAPETPKAEAPAAEPAPPAAPAGEAPKAEAPQGGTAPQP